MLLRLLPAFLLVQIHALELATYQGVLPKLPLRTPFGFGASSTGGSTNESATYIVTNSTELRTALALPFTKTIYVQGVIHGSQLPNGTMATCQSYIDNTGTTGAAIRQYNQTLYVYSLNATYTDLVKDAESKNITFEGRNATEYRTLLAHMNGWRAVVSQTQKAQVGFKLTNNTSLIGWDKSAALDGINLYLSSVNNVWIRNLKLVSPEDCFPAPESATSWNALYDAVGLVTSSNVWLDGCELQDQLSGEWVQPELIAPGVLMDRFDGLFDCEDGTDNITFSHNIVRNHHKSLLLGGGTKEADRDLGKMHFTLFGNHFLDSASRNPLMRFGTFDVASNLFESINNKQPLYTTESQFRRDAVDPLPESAVFQYHLGVYNQSNVLIRDNVFVQSGTVPQDTTRVFTFSEQSIPDLPAKVCIPANSLPSTLNGQLFNLTGSAKDTFDFLVAQAKIVDGTVVFTCDELNTSIQYELPAKFSSPEEVEAYVLAEAGQN